MEWVKEAATFTLGFVSLIDRKYNGKGLRARFVSWEIHDTTSMEILNKRLNGRDAFAKGSTVRQVRRWERH